MRTFSGGFSLFFVCFSFNLLAEAPTPPPGAYTCSWLGNTYMNPGKGENVTEEVGDVCISPNGIVFSAGYAETGGGGASYKATDGSFAGRYDRFESGFGDPVKSVAADNNFVYYGTGGKGILRAPHGGAMGGYSQFLGGNITGLHEKDGKLYVSNFGDGKIVVLNTSNMSEERSFSCPNPSRLTVDNNGNIWVVVWSSSSKQKPYEGNEWVGEKVVSFSSTGSPGPQITDFEQPLAVAVNKSGQLLVGGLNEHCQIWKYDISGTPTKAGVFGEMKGIFGGVAGAFAKTAKLHWIKGIAVDADDNIYTACVYGTFWGDGIEKFNSEGVLAWRVFAGTSLDCGGIDPWNPTEVYSKYHHYTLDYSKTAPGTEWSLTGFTLDRFKYPNDPRIPVGSDVGSRSLGGGAYRIGGKLFVVRGNQEGYRCEISRKETTTDGEVLVPSVNMGTGGDKYNHFYNPKTKTWIDKPKKDDIYNQYWNIASNGDILTIGINDKNKLIHYTYNGLDEFNNPNWDASKATVVTVSEFSWIRRISYEPDEDALYLCGDQDGDNNRSFLRVKKFPDWSKGNRTSSFTHNLPYNDTEYAGSSNYSGGTPLAFQVEGDYIFVCYGKGNIRIMKRTDGSVVGTLVQNINGYTGSDGQVDCAVGLSAYKRKNGEYILLLENAGYACINMIRWCPGECTDEPDVVIPEEGVSVAEPVVQQKQSVSDGGIRVWAGASNTIVFNGLPVGSTQVRICDLAGRTLYFSRCNTTSLRLPAQDFQRGLYVVTVGNEAKRDVLRITVK